MAVELGVFSGGGGLGGGGDKDGGASLLP